MPFPTWHGTVSSVGLHMYFASSLAGLIPSRHRGIVMDQPYMHITQAHMHAIVVCHLRCAQYFLVPSGHVAMLHMT